MLTLNFALTKEDFCNFYLFVMWDKPSKQKKRRLLYLKQIVTTILFLTVFYFTGLFNRSNSFAYIVVSFLLLTTILSITGLRSGLKSEANKISENVDNASIFLNSLVVINENGISLKDKLSERIFKWEAFNKLEENKDYYFIFYTASEALIFPKSIFKSEADKTIFDQLLSRFLSFEAAFGNQLKS